MPPRTSKAAAAEKPAKKTKSTGGGGAKKKLSEFNKFMKAEMARLKEDEPDMQHKDRLALPCQRAMSTMHDIDNDEILFQFDPFDSQQRGQSSSSLHLHPELFAHSMPSHDANSTSEELAFAIGIPKSQPSDKGKERSMPVPIRTSSIIHDLFDTTLLSATSDASTSFGALDSSSSSITAFSPDSMSFSSPDFDRYRPITASQPSPTSGHSFDPSFSSSPSSSKGKQRESSVPSLPPLSFSAIDFDCNQERSGSSSEAGLYSPQSLPTGVLSPLEFSHRDISIASPDPSVFIPVLDSSDHPTYRRRSLSNLLSPIPGSSIVPIALNSTFGPSQAPSNLSLQFNALHQSDIPLFDSANNQSLVSQTEANTLGLRAYQGETGNYPPGWYTASKSTTPAPSTLKALPSDPSAIPTSVLSPTTRGSLKSKTRSKSSPYPISALDYITITSSDVFQPLPLVVRNYFDLILPPELRLSIFRSLIDVHEADLQKAIEEGRFNMAKATSSKGRWVGRDKGIREIFKLSRVSRGWRDLVFDGQLWSELDLHSFPGLPPALIVQLTRKAGAFVRRLDLSGHIQLLPDSLTDIANDMCLSPTSDMDLNGSFTQLTTIKLQGCTALTTRSLHHLLVRCKNLQSLTVKGMSAVTNVTCDIIANFCPRVVSLDMSRCPNMDAEGIKALSKAALMRKEHLALKELRVSGLKHVTDSMMKLLGRAAPYLEVLDLSYSRQVHNSTIEAFVACDDLDNGDGVWVDGAQLKSKLHDLGVGTILVSARDLGREPNDTGKFRRRVTRLRHLVLSSCILLSDMACSNLAFSVPDLEFLELAGIGPDLKDEGLIRLLSTTPKIRRLDLEDATDITNAVLSTLTPVEDQRGNDDTGNPLDTEAAQATQPGHALEHLTVSYAENLSDVAMLRLIKACKNLRVLEADNTRIGSSVLKQFVRVARERTMRDAKIVAIDCRGIGESLIKDLSPQTRPRLGWRAYGARKLMYLDVQDDYEDELKVGQDECDPYRVVVKSFYSWQTVDAVKAIKEKRRRHASRRTGSDMSSYAVDDHEAVSSMRAARWWSPGGRRAMRTAAAGRTSPPLLPDLAASDGCRTM
ncbi:hypothetical protein CVT24_007839 [Panaeolus cyanescens]|uniref:F-box domain-containing protein n=1 Tax=Panaeolus cyanescens TaxID=181874 RepID=A0A409VZG5_9AGAR|nr:hypothetical protein CVT24_007839 [Panaeolus cyanescens]